jgi:Uma2 family endonuclease
MSRIFASSAKRNLIPCLPDQIRFPAPDFIAEVLSSSTEAKDCGIKYEDYAAHGVGEYWLVNPAEQVVEQYILHGESYKLRMKSDSGLVKSKVIAGFEIPIQAIFDKKENVKALKEMVHSERQLTT